jgi:cobalt-zinc-cadmium efflux system outer membrane protein
MQLPRGLASGVFLAFLGPSLVIAQETLTLEQALLRARERAPSVLSARARVDEARARWSAASLLFRENPEVDGEAGRPSSGDDRSTQFEVGLLQNLELGGRRSARMGIAGAELASGVSEAENALREASRDVASAFFRALSAQERLSLAERAESIATEILEAARKRHGSGDVALLDVNLAKAASARARADTHAARAAQSAILGELRVLLGIPPEQPLRLEGELRRSRRYHLKDLLAKAAERPDIRALQANRDAANAEIRLGHALSWPQFGLGVRYKHEEGPSLVMGALRMTLPVFDHGQGVRAEASARVRRLELELEALRRAVHLEVRTALEIYDEQTAGLQELERNALPLIEENEALSRQGYEAGQISLAELLLVQREVLETRGDYLSRLLDAAIAATELEASAGVLR